MTTKLFTLISAGVFAIGAASAVAAQTAAPPKSGIFLIGANGALTPLPGEMTQDVQAKGIGKSILTQGISKPTMTARHSGASAELVIKDPQPAFLFRFYDQARAAQMAQQDPMAYVAAMQGAGGGTPLTGKDAKEYALVKLTVDGDARLAASKGMETFKFETQKKSALEFEVRLLQPLEPGEYAFFWAKGGGAPSQIWAFSVKR